MPTEAAAAPAQVKRRKKKPWIAVIAVLLVAALTVGGVFTFRFVRDRMQYSEAMSDALESMEDGMYSDAISLYKEILEIRPDSEEAKAGLAKAECALALQNAAKALKALSMLMMLRKGWKTQPWRWRSSILPRKILHRPQVCWRIWILRTIQRITRNTKNCCQRQKWILRF